MMASRQYIVIPTPSKILISAIFPKAIYGGIVRSRAHESNFDLFDWRETQVSASPTELIITQLVRLFELYMQVSSLIELI